MADFPVSVSLLPHLRSATFLAFRNPTRLNPSSRRSSRQAIRSVQARSRKKVSSRYFRSTALLWRKKMCNESNLASQEAVKWNI